MPRVKPFTHKTLETRQKKKVKEIFSFSVREEDALHILEDLKIDERHLRAFMKALFSARAAFLSLQDKRISQQPIIGLIQPNPAEMVAALNPLLKSMEKMRKDYDVCPTSLFSKINIEVDKKNISVDEAMKVIAAFQSALNKAIHAQKSSRGSLDKNKNAMVDAALKLIDFLRFHSSHKKPVQEKKMFDYLDWCFGLIGIGTGDPVNWSFSVSHPWYPTGKVSAKKILREFLLKEQ